MTLTGKGRVENQLAFVLHLRPFKETSLIVEAFSRAYGRIALVARGARRPRSAMRGLLMAFQPLEMGWFGQSEVRTLSKIEWLGGHPLLQGQSLLLGYYMNELLLKLLPREDAHVVLYDAYAEAIRALALGESNQISLRRFEIILLRELGYGLTLSHEADSDHPIDPQKRYAYTLERGAVPLKDTSDSLDSFSGQTLLAIAREDFSDTGTLTECKRLMRTLIQHYLAGQVLNSRRVFMELHEL